MCVKMHFEDCIDILCQHLPIREYIVCNVVSKYCNDVLKNYESLYLHNIQKPSMYSQCDLLTNFVRALRGGLILLYVIHKFTNEQIVHYTCVEKTNLDRYGSEIKFVSMLGVSVAVIRHEYTSESTRFIPVHVLPGQFYCNVEINFFTPWDKVCRGIHDNFFQTPFQGCTIIVEMDNDLIAFVYDENKNVPMTDSMGLIPSSILIRFKDDEQHAILKTDMLFRFSLNT